MSWRENRLPLDPLPSIITSIPPRNRNAAPSNTVQDFRHVFPSRSLFDQEPPGH